MAKETTLYTADNGMDLLQLGLAEDLVQGGHYPNAEEASALFRIYGGRGAIQSELLGSLVVIPGLFSTEALVALTEFAKLPAMGDVPFNHNDQDALDQWVDAYVATYSDVHPDLAGDSEQRALWETIVDMVEIADVESASVLLRSNLRELQNTAKQHENLSLLLKEAYEGREGINGNRMALLHDPQMNFIATRLFPEAAELHELLTNLVQDEELERTRSSRVQTFKYTQYLVEMTEADMGYMAAMPDFQIAAAIGMDPWDVALCALRTDNTSISDEEFVDTVVHAPYHHLAYWLFGAERHKPTPELVKVIAAALSREEADAVAVEANRIAAEQQYTFRPEILTALMQHWYVPHFQLDLTQSLFVWDTLRDEAEGDYTMWLANLAGVIATDTPVRFEDLKN